MSTFTFGAPSTSNINPNPNSGAGGLSFGGTFGQQLQNTQSQPQPQQQSTGFGISGPTQGTGFQSSNISGGGLNFGLPQSSNTTSTGLTNPGLGLSGSTNFGLNNTQGNGLGFLNKPQTQPNQQNQSNSFLNSTSSGYGLQQQTQQTQQQLGLGQLQLQPQQNYINHQLSYNLQSNNNLKYEKIGNILSDEYKSGVYKIEETLFNNDILLQNSESIQLKLDENKKIILEECASIIKLTKEISSHHSNCSLLVTNLSKELNDQTNLISKVKKNINILENHSSLNISIPNDEFEVYIRETQLKIDHFQKKVQELEILVSIDNDSTTNNEYELIEIAIGEYYNYVVYLSNETQKINEIVIELKKKYVDIMKYHGYSQEEIEQRYIEFKSREYKI